MKTILNYLMKPINALVEAKKKHAAWNVAMMLKDSRDFQHKSVIDLYQEVLGGMKEKA